MSGTTRRPYSHERITTAPVADTRIVHVLAAHARSGIRALAPTMLSALLLCTAAAPRIHAQGPVTAPDDVTLDAIGSWIALHAQPGRELSAAETISRSLPGWKRDSIGNLVLSRGSGRPLRVVACGLDEAGYAVSAITGDGYLRLHYAGNARRDPLWDQFHQGQRIVVDTKTGPVPGVIGVPSTHLRRGQPDAERPVSIGELWVDVGARDSAEVRALGIEMLDPVTRDWPLWKYGAYVAGPAAADRAGCAAVAAASRSAPERGRTIFVISSQSAFRWAGLSGVLAPLGEVDTLVIAASRVVPHDTIAGHDPLARGAPFTRAVIRTPFEPVPGVAIHATIALAPRSLFTGTLVESVRAEDARSYASAVAAAAGIRQSQSAALPLPPLSSAATPETSRSRDDSLATTARLLTMLTESYGVSGHETPVREKILGALPAWAQSRTTTDSAGNLLLALGPDRDTVAFVAHMDEVGWDVAAIGRDGSVSLRRRGGFYPSLWEGQTAILHVERNGRESEIRGVFVPRDTVTTRQPRELVAWFGMDSAALAARGVTTGTSVTSLKTAARLGRTRFTARSIDDRAGCTALIEAVRAIQPDALTRKVIFAWVVREEIGLEGAAALASSLRGSIARVYAVDTFVSSDSPLDDHRFAFTPIGAGPVARALDNSSATPRAEVERVRVTAANAGIPIQSGTTNGGNDGSEFVRYGVRDVPISWPLRYSHSPAELVDLADIAQLGRLVAALAVH
jgi:putative aminopeptidase FrvX